MPNKYTFEETAPTFRLNDRRKSRSRNSSSGDEDGTGSLTYSATSSVTAESTDSSFGDIMKVLETQGDSKELASFLKKHVQHHRGDEKSVAADSLAYSAKSATSDSLAYSADGESQLRSLATDGGSLVSHLQGTALLSSGYVQLVLRHFAVFFFAGMRLTFCVSTESFYFSQHSDPSGDGGANASAMGASYLNNGGGQRHDANDDDNIFMMFSPAEHADSMKRRKEKKRRERHERRTAAEQKSPEPRLVKDSSASAPHHTNGQSAPHQSHSQRPGSITPTTHNIRGTDQEYSAHNSSSYPHHHSPGAQQSSSSRVATYEARQGPPSPVAHPVPVPAAHRFAESKCDRDFESPELPADDDDVWYAKWWMFCFHGPIQTVTPKR
jgi:hypothetical protein